MFRFLSALLAFALAAQAAPPQTSPQPPTVTFKVEVNYVEIDAVVTDAQGQFVSGLTKDDFQVSEAGTPQAITAFSRVDIPIERADPLLFRANTIDPDVRSNLTEFNGRVFLLVLDDLWTSPSRSRLVRAAATQFVRRFVGANDLVAAVTTGGGARNAQEFTSSHTRLIAAIDTFTGRKQRDEVDQERTLHARNTYGSLRNLAEYVGGIRGRRKAIVWFGEGIDYDIDNAFQSPNADVVRQEMQDTIAAATRANVSFYGVDARGVGAGLDEVIEIQTIPTEANGATYRIQEQVRRAQDNLRIVSAETGGFAIVNRNDLNGAFQQIIQENSSYYVLGYYSTDERRDGRFRDLQVRVTRPGLQVKARKGYVAPTGKPATAAPPLPGKASPALRDALESPIPTGGLGLSVFAAPFAGPAPKASVAVIVEVDPARLRFAEQNGTFNDDLEVVIIAVDSSGKSPDGGGELAPLRLTARNHESVQRYGLRLVRRLSLPPGRYTLHVGAREANGGAVGSVVMDLDVPDFSASPLAMSAVTLASAWASRIMTANPDPELKQVLPSSPTAQRTFPASDTLALFTDIYDNVKSPAHRVMVKTTVTADDGKVVFTSNDERRSEELGGKTGGYGYAATVPLKDLAPGRYVLQVAAQSSLNKGGAASRELEFRIR
jgi:VWFA-related protein